MIRDVKSYQYYNLVPDGSIFCRISTQLFE